MICHMSKKNRVAVLRAFLVAIAFTVVVGNVGVIILDYWSGLPGHFDQRSVDWGKGPQVGEVYRCINLRGSWDFPCTRDQYLEHQRNMLFLRPIILPFALLFSPYLFLGFWLVTFVLTAVIFTFDWWLVNRRVTRK